MRATLNTKLFISFAILALIFMSTLAPFSSSQLGEVAGQIDFVVPAGTNQTMPLRLIDGGNQSISVQIIPPSTLSPSNSMLAANQVVPTVHISPLNGTIGPHGELNINITVYAPKNDTPYLVTWKGLVSAQEVSNQTNPGGAVITEGVAKIFTITVAPPPPKPNVTNSTSSNQGQAPLSLNLFTAAAAIVVIILVLLIAYYLANARGASKKKRPKKLSEKERLQKEIQQLRKEKARLKKEAKPRPRKRQAKKATKSKRTTRRRRR